MTDVEQESFIPSPAELLRLLLELDGWDGPDYPIHLVGYIGSLGTQILHPGLKDVLEKLSATSSTVRMRDVHELKDRNLLELVPRQRSGEYEIRIPFRVRLLTTGRLADLPDLETLTQAVERGTALPQSTFNIAGETIVISNGSDHVNQSVVTVRAGNDADLTNALKFVGLGDEDVPDLKEAAEADRQDAGRPSIGRRLRSMIVDMAGRMTEAAVVDLGKEALRWAVVFLFALFAAWLGIPCRVGGNDPAIDVPRTLPATNASPFAWSDPDCMGRLHLSSLDVFLGRSVNLVQPAQSLYAPRRNAMSEAPSLEKKRRRRGHGEGTFGLRKDGRWEGESP